MNRIEIVNELQTYLNSGIETPFIKYLIQAFPISPFDDKTMLLDHILNRKVKSIFDVLENTAWHSPYKRYKMFSKLLDMIQAYYLHFINQPIKQKS